MINKDLVSALNATDFSTLSRENLGVHFNFKQSIPKLESIFSFLKEIVDIETNLQLLTNPETQSVEQAIKDFIRIREEIYNFDPQRNDNIANHTAITNRVSTFSTNSIQGLRTVYNFLKIKNQDLSKTQKDATELLQVLKDLEVRNQALNERLTSLPAETQALFVRETRNIADRLSQFENDQRAQIESARKEKQTQINSLLEETRGLVQAAQVQTNSFTEDARKKIEETLQQVRKFSAKETLSTYAEIFRDEAGEIKPAISRWTAVLIALCALEIAVALALFFVFLPEIVQISKNYGETTIGWGLLISILLTKIFILSVIAILINHTLKNLNAQRHLYATNKFKANALASFKAFIDATSDEQVINKIIDKVSSAVYTQGVSGYLSKDDKQATIIDDRMTLTAAKLLNL